MSEEHDKHERAEAELAAEFAALWRATEQTMVCLEPGWPNVETADQIGFIVLEDRRPAVELPGRIYSWGAPGTIVERRGDEARLFSVGGDEIVAELN